jgi:hypothetical protein
MRTNVNIAPTIERIRSKVLRFITRISLSEFEYQLANYSDLRFIQQKMAFWQCDLSDAMLFVRRIIFFFDLDWGCGRYEKL